MEGCGRKECWCSRPTGRENQGKYDRPFVLPHLGFCRKPDNHARGSTRARGCEGSRRFVGDVVLLDDRNPHCVASLVGPHGSPACLYCVGGRRTWIREGSPWRLGFRHRCRCALQAYPIYAAPSTAVPRACREQEASVGLTSRAGTSSRRSSFRERQAAAARMGVCGPSRLP